jgi:hypothetical protein
MRMKSGVQLNFLERRALADRALARLVEIARQETAAMSSREQRGVYQLESTLLENSSAPCPSVRVWVDPAFVDRVRVLWTLVNARVRGFWRRTWLLR